MSNSRVGVLVFFVGFAVMALSAAMGNVLQAKLYEQGITGLQQSAGVTGMIPAMVFFFSFPLGLIVCMTGAIKMRRSLTGSAWPYALLAVPAIAIVVLVPVVFGRELSPGYFGIGGVTVLLLVAATIFYWGSYRARQPANRHAAMDLQAIGYLCFALAAWNTCGFGSVPSFALFPEKMIAFDARGIAIGQLKAIMAFFVLGWLFSAWAFYKAARDARSGD